MQTTKEEPSLSSSEGGAGEHLQVWVWSIKRAEEDRSLVTEYDPLS